MLWRMKLLDLGGLKLFVLVISINELTINCVIGLSRFVWIFRQPMQMLERDHYFQCSAE